MPGQGIDSKLGIIGGGATGWTDRELGIVGWHGELWALMDHHELRLGIVGLSDRTGRADGRVRHLGPAWSRMEPHGAS